MEDREGLCPVGGVSSQLALGSSPRWRRQGIDEMKLCLAEVQKSIEEIREDYESAKNKPVLAQHLCEEYGNMQLLKHRNENSSSRSSTPKVVQNKKGRSVKKLERKPRSKGKATGRKNKYHGKKTIRLEEMGDILARLENRTDHTFDALKSLDDKLDKNTTDSAVNTEDATESDNINQECDQHEQLGAENDELPPETMWYTSEAYQPTTTLPFLEPLSPRDIFVQEASSKERSAKETPGKEVSAQEKSVRRPRSWKSSARKEKISLSLPVVHLSPRRNDLLDVHDPSAMSFSRLLAKEREEFHNAPVPTISARDYLVQFLQSNHLPMQLKTTPKKAEGRSREVDLEGEEESGVMPNHSYFPPGKPSVRFTFKQRPVQTEVQAVMHSAQTRPGTDLPPVEIDDDVKDLMNIKANPIIDRYVEKAKAQAASFRLCRRKQDDRCSSAQSDVSKVQSPCPPSKPDASIHIYKLDTTVCESGGASLRVPTPTKSRPRTPVTPNNPEDLSESAENEEEEDNPILLPRLPLLEETRVKKGLSSAAKFTYLRGKYTSRYWPSSGENAHGSYNSSPRQALAPDLKPKPISVVTLK